jgi:hypothetical protein
MYYCEICENKSLNKFIIFNYYNNFFKKLIKKILHITYLDKFIKTYLRKISNKINIQVGENIFLFKKVIFCESCNLGFTYPKIEKKILDNFYTNIYPKNSFGCTIDHENFKSKEGEEIYIKIKEFLEKL